MDLPTLFQSIKEITFTKIDINCELLNKYNEN